MYTEYPRDVEVQTPFGPVWLAITEANHVYVDCNSNGKTITISGKPVRFNAHLKFKNGYWAEDADSAGRMSLYAKKANGDETTDTQKRKIRDELFPHVIHFLNTHAELLRRAQSAHVNNRVEALEEEISKLHAQIAEKQTEIASLKL